MFLNSIKYASSGMYIYIVVCGNFVLLTMCFSIRGRLTYSRDQPLPNATSFYETNTAVSIVQIVSLLETCRWITSYLVVKVVSLRGAYFRLKKNVD